MERVDDDRIFDRSLDGRECVYCAWGYISLSFTSGCSGEGWIIVCSDCNRHYTTEVYGTLDAAVAAYKGLEVMRDANS